VSEAGAERAAEPAANGKSDPWTDLALTLPIFVVYHLGVIFLPFRNAADVVTSELHTLSKHSLPAYAALTLAVGVIFATVLATAGRRHALEPSRFARVALEGAVYATLMRFAGGYVVGALRLAKGAPAEDGVFPSVVMAMGAGFYEEIAFRVVIFGGGALLLRKLFASDRMGGALVTAAWGVIEACAFSAWHYTGSMGDQVDVSSFVFRAVCGLILTAIFAFRGFAPAVWTHMLYDVWVMVFE
jgi:membrane protease YdiL (CAAX protease family)